MDKPLQITLPLMLHNEEEIKSFLIAKKRLESMGERYNVSLEVGAFLIFMPASSRTPENFEKQLINQREYKIPLRLAEPGIQRQNSLSYNKEDPAYAEGIESDIEKVIEQISKLRKLEDNPSEDFILGVHEGLLVGDIKEGDFSRPGFYSIPDFLKMKDELLEVSKKRFLELKEFAKKYDITIALEPTYPVVVENMNSWQDDIKKEQFEMVYYAFNDLESIKEISQGKVVLDVAHFSASKEAPSKFEINKDVVKPDNLFSAMGVSSWEEYNKQLGNLKEYVEMAKAFHISPSEGIGIRLPKNTELARRWGSNSPEENISKETYLKILKHAHKNNLPVAIEVDYSLNPMTYREADEFLEPILKEYNSFQKI